jgi:hypothetical protein
LTFSFHFLLLLVVVVRGWFFLLLRTGRVRRLCTISTFLCVESLTMINWMTDDSFFVVSPSLTCLLTWQVVDDRRGWAAGSVMMPLSHRPAVATLSSS